MGRKKAVFSYLDWCYTRAFSLLILFKCAITGETLHVSNYITRSKAFIFFVLILPFTFRLQQHKLPRLNVLKLWSIKAVKTRTHMGIIVEGQRRLESAFYGVTNAYSILTDPHSILTNAYSIPPYYHCCAIVIIAFVSLVQKIHASSISISQNFCFVPCGF